MTYDFDAATQRWVLLSAESLFQRRRDGTQREFQRLEAAEKVVTLVMVDGREIAATSFLIRGSLVWYQARVSDQWGLWACQSRHIGTLRCRFLDMGT